MDIIILFLFLLSQASQALVLTRPDYAAAAMTLRPFKPAHGHFNVWHRCVPRDKESDDQLVLNVDTLSIRTLQSIEEVSASEWNSLLDDGPDSSPFMNWHWLQCLEASGCASTKVGWQPLHLLIYCNRITLHGHKCDDRIRQQTSLKNLWLNLW